MLLSLRPVFTRGFVEGLRRSAASPVSRPMSGLPGRTGMLEECRPAAGREKPYICVALFLTGKDGMALLPRGTFAFSFELWYLESPRRGGKAALRVFCFPQPIPGGAAWRLILAGGAVPPWKANDYWVIAKNTRPIKCDGITGGRLQSNRSGIIHDSWTGTGWAKQLSMARRFPQRKRHRPTLTSTMNNSRTPCEGLNG
jgi:hypothetical protein